ncbi:hypothetical protein FB451DRAFT_1563686 [Mycena latifolia]|nr:hypothetical protein FB451DRAFT_1563686 [Mycena latifolia]
MSTNPLYSAADILRCDQYAARVRGWLNHENDHPGPPPPAYNDHYRRIHPTAPVPSDFPNVEREWERYISSKNAARSNAPALGDGVSMSADSFAQFLNLPGQLLGTVSAVLKKGDRTMVTGMGRVHGRVVGRGRYPGPSKPTGRLPMYGIAARGRPLMGHKNRAGNGLIGRVGGSLHNKGWRRGRHHRGKKHARVEAAAVTVQGVVVDTVAPADLEARREETPPQVVEEDVHMDDWLVRREDEEDDGSAGNIIGWDGEEAVPIM